MGGFKSKITKEAQQQTKKSKETNMKKPIIITVLVTVTVIGLLATYGYFAYQFGVNTEKARYESVKAEAKVLTATVSPSKK